MQNLQDRRVIFGVLPYVVIRSLETDAFVAIIASFDMLIVRRSPAKSNRESTQVAVANLKHRKVQDCVSQNSHPKKSILRKAGQVRMPKRVTLMCEILARLS